MNGPELLIQLKQGEGRRRNFNFIWSTLHKDDAAENRLNLWWRWATGILKLRQSVSQKENNQNKTKIQWPGNKSWDDANKKFKSIVCSLAPGFYFHPSHNSVLQVQVLSSSDQLVQLMWRHACNALPLVQVQCRALCETSWIRSIRRRVES